MESKNYKLARSFFMFCHKHPEQRFWQALKNWSGLYSIEASYIKREGVDCTEDTYYWEEKDR